MLFEIRIMGRIAVSGVGDQSFQMTDAGYLLFPSYESSNVRVWKKKSCKKMRASPLKMLRYWIYDIHAT